VARTRQPVYFLGIQGYPLVIRKAHQKASRGAVPQDSTGFDDAPSAEFHELGQYGATHRGRLVELRHAGVNLIAMPVPPLDQITHARMFHYPLLIPSSNGLDLGVRG
jgi:hypothetical protein